MTIEDREYRGEYGMPRLGDYAILRINAQEEWPDVVTAGLFSETWQLSH